MVRETELNARDFIYPLFVRHGSGRSDRAAQVAPPTTTIAATSMTRSAGFTFPGRMALNPTSASLTGVREPVVLAELGRAHRPDGLLGADGQASAQRRLGGQLRVHAVLHALVSAGAGALLLEDDGPLAVDGVLGEREPQRDVGVELGATRQRDEVLGLASMWDDPEWATAPEFDTEEKRERFWEIMLEAARRKTVAEWNEVFEREPDVWAAVGFHPHEAKDCDDAAFAEISRLAASERVVAIGEIGLDYHYMHSPRDTQRDVFMRHVALAKRLDLPVIVHNRESTDDLLRDLRNGVTSVG